MISHRFECTASEGAILVPGSEITALYVQANDAWFDYVRANYESWFTFATAKGRRINLGDIILVSGYMKASSWAVAAVSSGGSLHAISCGVDGPGLAFAKFYIERSTGTHTSFDQRAGPKRSNAECRQAPQHAQFLPPINRTENTRCLRSWRCNEHASSTYRRRHDCCL